MEQMIIESILSQGKSRKDDKAILQKYRKAVKKSMGEIKRACRPLRKKRRKNKK